MKDIKQKSLTLVLGGGSALGFADIGFLQVLEENSIKIDAMVGSSSGSLLGAFVACGYTAKEIENLALEKLKIRKFIPDLQPITFWKRGLISGKRIERFFESLLKDKKIEELDMQFISVATDIIKGEPYYIKEGPVSRAVRLSISVPGIFRATKVGDKLIVDGGIGSNLPVEVAKDLGKDVIIAVDVLGEDKLNKPPKNTIAMLLSAYMLLQFEATKYKPNPADLTIRMNLEESSVMTFTKKGIKKLIAQGRMYAEENIEEIKRLLF